MADAYDEELAAAQAAWERAWDLAKRALREVPADPSPWTPLWLPFATPLPGPSPWAKAAQGERAAKRVAELCDDPELIRLAKVAIGTIDLPCCFEWRGRVYRAEYRGRYPGEVERVTCPALA